MNAANRRRGTASWSPPAVIAVAVFLLVAAACSTSQAGQDGGGSGQDASPAVVATAAPTAATTPTPEPRRTPEPRTDPTRDPSAQYIPWYTDVHITEGSLTIDDPKFAGEEIYFSVFNDGEEAHDAVVVPWDGAPGSLPVDAQTNRVAVAALWSQPTMDGGNTEVFEIEPIAPGKYVMFCSLPGHYQRGEYAGFEVIAPR